MKKVFLLLGLVALITSCDKLDQLTTFQFSRTGEFTIPATTVVGVPITLNTPDITTSYIQEFESNGMSTDNVEYIKLVGMKVGVKSPAGETLDFLKSVTLSISADGLAESEIASKSNIPNNGALELDFDVSEVDLKQYMMKDNFKMKASAELDQVITQDVTIYARPTFEVKGNVL